MNRIFKAFCFLAAISLLTATPLWGQANLLWTGFGADTLNFNASDNWTDSVGAPGDPNGQRLFINTVAGDAYPYPIFGTAGYPTTVNAWDLLIGTNGEGWDPALVMSTPGQLDMVGGDMEVRYAIRVGNNGLAGTLNLTSGILHKWDNGGDLDVGIGGGTGIMTIGSTATLTMDHNWTTMGNGPGAIGTMTTSGTVNLADVLFLGRSGGSGTWNQVGGTTTVRSSIFLGEWDTDAAPGVGILNVSGGGTVAMMNIEYSAWRNPNQSGSQTDPATVLSTQTVNLNDGTLKALRNEGNFFWTKGSPGFNVYIKSLGGTFDTNGLSVTFQAPLQDDGTSTSGGFTKTGIGVLTLIKSNTYLGPTTVAQGTLNVNGTGSLASSGITVNSGAVLAGTTSSVLPATVVNGGGTVAATNYAGSAFLNLAGLTLNDKGRVAVRSFDAGYNTIGLSSALITTGTGIVSALPASIAGGITGSDFPLIQWSYNSSEVAPNLIPTTNTVGVNVLTLSYDPNNGGVSYINGKLTPIVGSVDYIISSGTYSDPAIWTNNNVQQGAGAVAYSSSTANGTIAVTAPLTVGTIIFDNTGNAFTGRDISMSTTTAAAVQLTVMQGAHSVANNLKLNNDLAVTVFTSTAGSQLSLNGILSGAAGISFDGQGTLSGDQWDTANPLSISQGVLTLTGANTFTGPVVMTGFGKLEIPSIDKVSVANPLGKSGVAAANLVINGELALTATSATPVTYETDRGFTLAGTSYAYTDPQVHTGPGGLDIISVNENVTLKITGQTAVEFGMTAVFAKTGAGTLVLANAGTANVLPSFDIQVQGGTLVFDTGTYTKPGRENTYFQYSGGDLLVGYTTGMNTNVVIQNGATFNNGGETKIGIDGGVGNMSITTGGVLSTTNPNFLGQNGGTAHVSVTGATYNSTSYMNIACGSGGIADVTLTDSSMTVNDWFSVGRDNAASDGTFEMNDSTLYVGNWVNVGAWGNPLGAITMNGASTASTGEVHIGQQGRGSLTMNANTVYTARNYLYVGTDGGAGTMTMNGDSSFTTGPELYVGLHGGSTGTLEMNNTAHATVNGWAQVGREGGTGTLTMTGSSNLWVTEEFRLGWIGGTGNLDMSGTSYISANHFGNIGRDGGSSAIVNMTGSSKLVCRWDAMSFGSNGGHAEVTMNGDNPEDYVAMGNVAGFACDTWWISFGRDGGSTATLEMSGYSRVNAGGYNVDIGVWSAVATATMAGNAEIRSGDLNIGYQGTGSLEMSNSSAVWANGQFLIGVGAAGDGDVTVGSTTGTAIVSVGAHLRVGYEAGNGTMNIGPGANIGVNQWIQVGNNDSVGLVGGVGIVNMTGGLITKNAVADTFMLMGRAATGTWTQSAGTTDIRTGVNMGGTGATGTLNLSGDAVFSTGFIHAGWDALGDATATMKINFDGGTLKVNPNSLYVGGKDYKVDDVVVESAVFVDSRLSTTSDIAILSGGATVDTSGANVSINTAIVEDPLSTGGNFTKIGDGMLTLTGSVGYTGDTIVNVGGLTVNAGLNTPTATVYVATGTTLNAPSIVADTLVIGGGPYVAATAAAVPEPSTFVLLALAGMVALFAARRRK